MLKKIVVWDPDGTLEEGDLPVEQAHQQLAARGVAMLPVETDLFKLSGCGGYFSRHWGRGLPIDHPTARTFGPATLYCKRDFRGVHWAARIVPEPETLAKIEAGEPYGLGQIRLTGDTAQPSAISAALSPIDPAVDLRSLGKPDAHGGWTVGGKMHLHPAVDGYHAFSLYGAAQGFRLAWLALTTTPTA